MPEKKCNNCAGREAMTTVTMSSADWQRNEQRHEIRERRLCFIIFALVVSLLLSHIGWLSYTSNSINKNEIPLSEYIENGGDAVNDKDHN